MGTFDLTLGCLLVASWANMSLFTLEIQQIFTYFHRYKRDPIFNKAMVLIALAGDILGVVSSLTMVYYYLVSHWGEPAVLATEPWTYPAYVVSIGITSGAVQIFLARMAYTLTKQWFWIPVIGSMIVVVVVGEGMTAAHLVNSTLGEREKLVTWATVWLSASVATDTLITIILVAKLQALKTGFSGTSNLLQSLSLAAVRNGSIITVMTIVTVIVFKAKPETNTAVMIEMIVGRVYSLSMLSNLNNRSLARDPSSSPGTSKGNPSQHRTADQTPSVVHVHREVDIRMDPLEFGRNKKGDVESFDDASANSYPAGKPIAFN